MDMTLREPAAVSSQQQLVQASGVLKRAPKLPTAIVLLSYWWRSLPRRSRPIAQLTPISVRVGSHLCS